MLSKVCTVLCIAATLALVGCNVSDDAPVVGNNSQNNTTSPNSDNCDPCGVCDDDPTNDCEVDCAGTPGGDAAEDACGVCDADPTNDCEIDCAGTPGGDAYEDPCGVCDADPENDCEIDCSGTPGGDAYEDECGVCDAEPQNDCQPDCAGTFGGDAYEDACGVCDADPENDCVEDCEGVPDGPAVLDFCGRCTGGTTGRLPCDVLELPVVADATIDSDNASTNFGGEVTVNTESDVNYGYFRYDLSNLADDDVVYNVELTFSAVDGEARSGDGTTYVEAIPNDTWDESAITWDTQPDATDLELLGTFDATSAANGPETFAFSSDQLASLVARESAGNDLVSIRLRSPGYKVRFASKEAPMNVPTMRVGVVKAREVVLEPVAGATIERGSSSPYSGDDSHYIVLPSQFRPVEHGMLLRFDLSSLPANAQIERVFVSATASNGFAYGGDGNVYTILVQDDSWDETTVTGADLMLDPIGMLKPQNLGFWWLWYNRSPIDRVGVNGSLKLVPVIQQELTTDQLVSFYFSSTGYETEYYRRDAADASKRPKLRILYIIPGQ